jgi:hypothetical protein
MTYRCQQLRDSAEGRSCVRCGANDGTIVGAHYTGPRRLTYGGGHSIKVHDYLLAHLCGHCHEYMDRLSRDKAKRWEHSEEFLHLIALTWERWINDGTLSIKGSRAVGRCA